MHQIRDCTIAHDHKLVFLYIIVFIVNSIVDHRVTAVIRIMSKFSLDADIISSIVISKDLIEEINLGIHIQEKKSLRPNDIIL